MKNANIRLYATLGLLVLGVSLLTQSARCPSGEPGNDYAEFVNDPYPWGSNTITIHFYHESACVMYIDLHNYNDSIVYTWTIGRTTHEGYLTYEATSYDGRWTLYCRVLDSNYPTDEARDMFNIVDPDPTQNNLGSDWARHPQDYSIYDKVTSILNHNSSLDAYAAAHLIQSHVLQYFDHNGGLYDNSFKSDAALLSDLMTYGKYRGVCRSDAVILTAYARSIGLPARIVNLWAHQTEDEPHYFAEFYIPNAPSTYKWISVDGDNAYGWFDQPETNQDLSDLYRHDDGWRLTAMYVITCIPYGGILDDFPEGYRVPYPAFWAYYRNILP